MVNISCQMSSFRSALGRFLDDLLLRSFMMDISIEPAEVSLRWNQRKLKFFLKHPLAISWGDVGATSRTTVVIPEGQRSNGESVPNFLRPFFPPYGELFEASVLHDGLRSDKTIPQRVADHVMLGWLRQNKYPKVRRALVFWAIRLGGWLKGKMR